MPSSALARDRGNPVYVVGEALIDVLDDDGERSEVPGGSAANVALGLARRGIPVRLSTCLGPDQHGRHIADFLAEEGVDLDSTAVSAERTSTAVATRRPGGEATYEFDIVWNLPVVDLHNPMALFHLGSFPAFFSATAELLPMLESARSRATVTFDPNVRPALIGDRDDARERFQELVRHIDVVKLSDADADYLMPGQDVDSIIDTLLESGLGLVVVTLGSDGLVVAAADARVRIPAKAVDHVVDTIGAGDSVMASLIADLVQGRAQVGSPVDLAALGERAVNAAAITVSRAGADLPYAAELDVQTFA